MRIKWNFDVDIESIFTVFWQLSIGSDSSPVIKIKPDKASLISRSAGGDVDRWYEIVSTYYVA